LFNNTYYSILDKRMGQEMIGSASIIVQHQGHGLVRLILFNYHGEWRNRLYDKANRTAVQLKVLSIEGKRCNFIYSGMRTVGLLIGDVAAARDKEPEWYKIHVRRMSVSNQRKEETIAATWKRILQPA
jgi:hypothetical protein